MQDRCAFIVRLRRNGGQNEVRARQVGQLEVWTADYGGLEAEA